MNATAVAGVGLVVIALVLILRWRYRSNKHPPSRRPTCSPVQLVHKLCPHRNVVQRYEVEQKDSLDDHLDVLTRKLAEKHPPSRCPTCSPVQLVHKLCPHRNVVQRYEVEQKDSLDDHLDVLTRKLAEKEGRLRLSKYKIRETQNEIENLQAIDQDVRLKYKEIVESLRTDLMSNEKECKKLQEQIEWVSRKRVELKDEVRLGQRLYGEAAAELASNLAELQRGRSIDLKVIDKPFNQQSVTSLRRRKEPTLPRASPVSSLNIKTSPYST